MQEAKIRNRIFTSDHTDGSQKQSEVASTSFANNPNNTTNTTNLNVTNNPLNLTQNYGLIPSSPRLQPSSRKQIHNVYNLDRSQLSIKKPLPLTRLYNRQVSPGIQYGFSPTQPPDIQQIY